MGEERLMVTHQAIPLIGRDLVYLRVNADLQFSALVSVHDFLKDWLSGGYHSLDAMLDGSFNQGEDIDTTMKKTLAIAAACSALLLAGQTWAFGGGAGPRVNNPGYGAGNYDQAPYAGQPGSGSGGGFGGGPGAGNPGYGRGYGPGGPANVAPGSGAGFGGAPYGQQPGPGYGGYQQAAPGGYNAYQQPPRGYAPPQGYGYQPGPGYGAPAPAQEEYDIPRNNYGQQYHPGPGGYPQAPAQGGYYGNPGYGYPPPPPPGYADDYYPDRDDKKSGGFPNPMNMMGNPMKMFGGGKDRD
ncbi:MAG: hypothetical protein QNJ78_03960 [Gammaproteobacteria bacterium]|nr:hypothetical protein [Gammaproteobacteria bacterium]